MKYGEENEKTLFGLNKTTHHERVETTEGRFPTNLILTHHPECVCQPFKYTGEEEVQEDWTCHEECPVKILDSQNVYYLSTLFIGRNRYFLKFINSVSYSKLWLIDLLRHRIRRSHHLKDVQ